MNVKFVVNDGKVFIIFGDSINKSNYDCMFCWSIFDRTFNAIRQAGDKRRRVVTVMRVDKVSAHRVVGLDISKLDQENSFKSSSWSLLLVNTSIKEYIAILWAEMNDDRLSLFYRGWGEWWHWQWGVKVKIFYSSPSAFLFSIALSKQINERNYLMLTFLSLVWNRILCPLSFLEFLLSGSELTLSKKFIFRLPVSNNRFDVPGLDPSHCIEG